MEILQKGGYMASLDLADAYYSVPVDQEDRKYLRLKWRGNLFQYACLPNGLAQAPRNFTKILKPIFGHLATRGFTTFGYIDDTFIWGDTFEECETAVESLRTLFVRLGFKIQREKSVFTPTREITFLGYVLNSVTMKVYPTGGKNKWWTLNLSRGHRRIWVDLPEVTLTMDACDYGWGAIFQKPGQDKLSTNDHWDLRVKGWHINVKETLAVWLGLSSFAKNLRACNIKCRVDTTKGA